jgi:hypothetical protein
MRFPGLPVAGCPGKSPGILVCFRFEPVNQELFRDF